MAGSGKGAKGIQNDYLIISVEQIDQKLMALLSFYE